LEVNTNLATGTWLELTNTGGLSSRVYPVAGANASYFQLINPF
jgi:hypothetical protein